MKVIQRKVDDRRHRAACSTWRRQRLKGDPQPKMKCDFDQHVDSCIALAP